MVNVSIVVPLYNAEAYIERCLKALLSQTYTLFEIIIVDDGSTDNGFFICRKYADEDDRIRLIRQENKGPSAARNRGLEEAAGTYLICVDADDVLHADALEKMVSAMERSCSDVCIIGWNRIEGDIVKPYRFDKNEMHKTTDHIIHDLFYGDYRCGGGNPWNKLWRTDKICENGKIIRFDESLLVYEDMLWTVKCLQHCETAVFVQDCLYDYYIYSTSVSRFGTKLEKKKRFCTGAEAVYKYIETHGEDNKEIASKWYRDLLIAYLAEKIKTHNVISVDELAELKQLPVKPWDFRSPRFFMWCLIIRLCGTLKTVTKES